MAGRKLVTDFRNAEITGSDLHEPGAVLPLSDNHGIDNTMLVATHSD